MYKVYKINAANQMFAQYFVSEMYSIVGVMSKTHYTLRGHTIIYDDYDM